MQSSAILLARTLPDKAPTRIQLCGRLAVELEGRELTPRLPGGQARVLLTYLVVNRALPARRDELIEAIWPCRPPAGADASLSALLSRLRSVLGASVLSGGTPVTLRLPAGAWIDLEAAHEAIHRAESAVAQQADWARALGPVAGRPLHRAARLSAGRGSARGPRSTAAASRRSAPRRSSAMPRSRSASAAPSSRPGERVARELVAIEPYRERAHALLMEILVARGNAAEALRVYEALRSGCATSSAPPPRPSCARSRRSCCGAEHRRARVPRVRERVAA